ncbi:MAG TPA: hypothetical protein VKU36_05645 [Candidatus Babeliales bacterium]|nr:hypothetical protein [Candidatus Babeliales bacterium]
MIKKNRSFIRYLLLGICVPLTLQGMQPTRAIKLRTAIKPQRTQPTVQPKPQPLPTKPEPEPITIPSVQQTKTQHPQAIGKESIFNIAPRKEETDIYFGQEKAKPPIAVISPKDQLPLYTDIIENAERYNAKQPDKAQQLNLNPFLENLRYIEETPDEYISHHRVEDIANNFSQLEQVVEAKTLLIQLKNLKTAAVNINPLEKPIQQIEFIAKLQNTTNMDDFDPQEIQDNIQTLTDSILEFIHTQINASKEPRITEKYKELARTISKGNVSTQNIFNITKDIDQIKNEIKQAKLAVKKEAEAQKLQAEFEAAEKKAAQELAQREEEKLQKEIDDLHEEIEKEWVNHKEVELRVNQAKKEKSALEQKKEKLTKNKAQQEKITEDIKNLDTQIDALEQKLHKKQQKMEHNKQQIEEKTALQQKELEKEYQAFEEHQQIEHTQRLANLETAKADALHAKNEAIQAEHNAQQAHNKLDALIQYQKAQLEIQQTQAEIVMQEQSLFEATKTLERIRQEAIDARLDFKKQQEQIELKAQEDIEKIEQDNKEQLQKAADSLKNSKDFIAQTAAEQNAKLEVLEQTFNQEAAIKQQQIEKEHQQTVTRINKNYEQDLHSINAQLEQFIQTRAQKAGQKQQPVEPMSEIAKEPLAEEPVTEIAEKPENPIEKVEKPQEPEKLPEEKKETKSEEPKIEHKEIKEKIEGHGSGEIPEQPDATQTTEEKKDITKETEQTSEQPPLPINLEENKPIPQEKTKIADVVPETETIPEVIPTAQPEKTPPLPTSERISRPKKPKAEQPGEIAPPSAQSGGSSIKPLPVPKITPSAEPKKQPFKPTIPSGSGASPQASSVANIPQLGQSTRYQQRYNGPVIVPEKEVTALPETKIEKTVQPKETVWWEKMLPQWIVHYLGRKDRAIKEKPTPEQTEAETPVEPQEEPALKETGILDTIIQAVKAPIANAISYIRGWFGA